MKNDVVRKTVYDKLVAKVNGIDISGFVLQTKYDTDKSGSERKIPDTIRLVQKLDYDAKITEIENKIPNISGLATNSALTAVENEILDICSLVKIKDIIQKLVKLRKNLMTVIMANILLLQNLLNLNLWQKFLMQDYD